MIIDANGKRPFEIRDSTGKEFKKIYDADGNLLFKNWNTIQGTPPIVFKGYNRSLKNYKIYGNTVQNGTPSPEAPVDVVGCGVRTVNLFSGEFSQFNNVGGTGDIYAYFYIPEDFTLTLIAKDTHTIPSNVYLGITKDGGRATGGFKWAILQRLDVTEGDIFTVESSINGYHYVSMYRKDASALNWMLAHYYIMLNLGSTTLPYEPYGYNIPISSGGKNLLDESASSDADATHINYNKNAPIILTTGQTYTFSCNTVCNGLYFRSVADDSNLAGTNNSNTLTYTPQVNVRAYCRVWNSNGITNLNPMLNCGSTQLPYEPYNRTTTPVYVGSEPLHKIDDYADYIDFNRGVVTRRIKKLVLTGEETWWTSGTYLGAIYAYHSQFPGIKPLTPIFCTHLVNACSDPYAQGTCKNDANSVGMWIFDTTTSPTAFKSYLAAQYAAGTPVTVWYVLAEPEETPLSDLDPITPLKGANTLSTNATIQPSEIYLKGKIKSLATHMLVDSSDNILLTSNNYQLVTKEE